MEASPPDEGAAERDTADDWRIGARRGVATVAELEGRIDVAMATARTAEEAALEIGAASLEAAEQARRAAALAERASAAAARAASEVAGRPATSVAVRPAASSEPPVAVSGSSEPAGFATSGAASVPVVSEPAGFATPSPAPVPVVPVKTAPRSARRRSDPFDERLTAFRERAESVMIRLQKLEAGSAPGDGPSEVVRLRP